jgi:hypothetical protein
MASRDDRRLESLKTHAAADVRQRKTQSIEAHVKISRFIGVGALALSLFACSSSPSTGSSGGGSEQGSEQSSGGGNTTSNGSNASSGGAASGGSASSGNTVSGSGSGGTSSSSGSGSSGSAGSSGGGSASQDDAGQSSQGDGGLTVTNGAPPNDPDIDYSVAPVTLTMTPFKVPANQEVYYCQNFANPWGKQADIKVYSLNMGTGSHHMFAFYQQNATNAAITPCPSGGLTFGAFTFVSQSPKKTVDFPQSVGATIPAGYGFQLMVHYLNTSTTEITSSVSLQMYIAKAGAVTQHAGCLFLNNTSITVAANCTAPNGCPSSDTYTLPQDVNILSTEGHMHKYGTNFVTTVSPAGSLPNGQLYQTSQWDEPAQQTFATPVKIPSGTKITWTCTDVNTTGQELKFGESAVTNVMCISQSIFYPVSNINNPVLGAGGGGL